MNDYDYMTYDELAQLAISLAEKIKIKFPKRTKLAIYGHPRGGVSTMLSVIPALIRDYGILMVDHPSEADLIIDDIYDSGATARTLECYDRPMFFLLDKREDRIDKWIVFPWETEWKKKHLLS